jgi:aspartyl-tRNA synthetase
VHLLIAFQRAFVAQKNTSLSAALGDVLHDNELTELVSGCADSEAMSSLAVEAEDTVFLARRRDPPEGGSTLLGRTRLQLLERSLASGSFVPPKEPHILWVTEFPLFTRADEDKADLSHGRWASSHHPFTAPVIGDVETLMNARAGKSEDQIRSIKGQHYDLVLNGVELGGGSVRVHDPVMQEHIFKNILELDEREYSSFQHLLHALSCGAPPHGGIALGKRFVIVRLLC